MPEIDLILPEPHPAQHEILDNARRFNHLRCGRRFGKTELIAELCLPALEDGEPIGIWYPTYKDSTDVWKKVKKVYGPTIRKKDETNRKIEFVSGGNIDFWAMDNPESGQGFYYRRAIIDEGAKAHKFKEAWEETIRPTLTDLRGDAWIMSRPKPNTYFKELEDLHKGKSNWAFFHYTTYDNPYIDRDEIEDAKKDLDSHSFDQEYMAEYVDPEANYFLYTFDEKVHVKPCQIVESLPLKLAFDFNVEPFATLVYQTPTQNMMNILHEIHLNNSDIYQVCDYIKAKYPKYTLVVTGDVSGKNRTGVTRGKTSYWKVIRDELSLMDHQIRLRAKNLDLITSRVLCNSAFQNKVVNINPDCKNIIKESKYAIVDDHGILVKNRREYKLDIFDCLRYACDAEWPNILKKY